MLFFHIDPKNAKMMEPGGFNIILSALKLALLASFMVRYSFESLTQ